MQMHQITNITKTQKPREASIDEHIYKFILTATNVKIKLM